jgi:uncharacterized protein YjiS (DUF1127 family)
LVVNVPMMAAWAGLSEHILRDLGLARTDVQVEAAKPFWPA